MFLRVKTRFKDGKPHRYWSLVENHRTADQRVVQRQVLYLGEINDTQQAAWCKTLATFQEGESQARQIALFPADRAAPELACEVVQLRLNELQLHRPRQWGGCWLACQVWDELQLDQYWADKLPPSRQGTRWLNVFKTLVCYRWLDPGSEWRLHRHWYAHSAMADLLGDEAGVIPSDQLYRCLDKVVAHKRGLFTFLRHRWQALFKPRFDILLYDVTSTCFEADPPAEGKRQFGYSRDTRSDCVQVVIALIVTPEGFPLAYEVMAGNTSDKTTLAEFLRKIETQYGKSERIWVMDRGIPTEEVLSEMRQSDPPVYYLVGTPKGRLHKLEQALLPLPWQAVRPGVEVKLLTHEQELYVLAKSHHRIDKERAMRRRQLKALIKRLKEITEMTLTSSQTLLLKLGAAKGKYPAAFRLIDIRVTEPKESSAQVSFSFRLNREKLRSVRRREGRYLLRTNLSGKPPAQLWQFYIQLVEIEAAFKNLKDDLQLRPIYHQ